MPGASDSNSTAEMATDNSISDEWEYEYDETETESFYINIDLTSCNGVIRPPRGKSSSANSPPNSSTSTPYPNSSGNSPPLSPEEQDDDDDLQVPGPEMALRDEIQIMDLHSRNPIISYQNQVFSCSWADMIGTELLFSHPEGRSDLPSVRRNKEYELISANRVKIIGKKGTLITSSFERPEPLNDYNVAEEVSSSAGGVSSLTTPSYQPSKRPLTNQARFLERLANAKRARGENDVVRTSFSQKRSEEFEARLRGWTRTEERMAEFERLNQRVLQGDESALEALEEIYEEIEGSSALDGIQEQLQLSQPTGGDNIETDDREGDDNHENNT